MMNSIDLAEHNKYRLDQKEARRIEKLIEPSKPFREGFYQGYDSASGKYIVRLEDGSVIKGKLISNASIAIGGKVQVTIPLNGTPIIKSNPV